MHSGSMPRVGFQITTPGRRAVLPTVLPALRAAGRWPIEALRERIDAARQRRAARRAWEAEEQRLEWWRSH
jgi:hypothetical protein